MRMAKRLLVQYFLFYLSMIFSDLPTIIHHRNKGFLVDSVKNIITKSQRHSRDTNKSMQGSSNSK